MTDDQQQHRETPAASEPDQALVEEQRESINREKGRGIEPPTSVQEQVDQLDPGTSEHDRRDPLAAAEAQRVEDEEQ